MKESFEAQNQIELRLKVEAHRQRIRGIETGRTRPKATGRATWCRLSRRPAWALPLVIVGALVAPGVLGAQSKPDALFIDENGKVGIGTTPPNQKLSVSGSESTDHGFDAAIGILNRAEGGGNWYIRAGAKG